MNYILDTDTLIYFLKGQEEVVKRVAHTDPSSIHTTIISQTELLFGAFHSTRKKQNLTLIEEFLKKITILPFSEKAAYFFAEQKASLNQKGALIADMDMMIASISSVHHMVLVTNNVKHFGRIKSLTIENWATTKQHR